VQLPLGVYIHQVYDASRISTPVLDKLHWYLGRLTLVFSCVVIPLGGTTVSVVVGRIGTYSNARLTNTGIFLYKSTAIWAIVLWFIWIAFILGIFIYLYRLKFLTARSRALKDTNTSSERFPAAHALGSTEELSPYSLSNDFDTLDVNELEVFKK
jgi:hypothetical protein